MEIMDLVMRYAEEVGYRVSECSYTNGRTFSIDVGNEFALVALNNNGSAVVEFQKYRHFYGRTRGPCVLWHHRPIVPTIAVDFHDPNSFDKLWEILESTKEW